MVITVPVMRMMEVAIHQVIHMIPVWNSRMTAPWTMHMVLVMP